MAADQLLAALHQRVADVLALWPGCEATVLLSGGVDSIAVAALATSIAGPQNVRAVTISAPGAEDAQLAARVADALGINHLVANLTDADVGALAKRAKRLLGTGELWEVAAAIPLLASEPLRSDGPTLTGSGADAILAGGRKITAPIPSQAATIELDQLVRTEAGSNFRRERLVPHFYEALLPKHHERHIDVFQTVQLWQVSETLAPSALYGEHDGATWDKFALRLACSQLLGTHSALAWSVKAPLQRSAGIFASLTRCAAAHTAQLPDAGTYVDPTQESLADSFARLYLDII